MQNEFVMRRLVQAKENEIRGVRGNCYWE